MPALAAAEAILADGEWHGWTDVVTAMIEHSDLTAKSASNRLHTLVGLGILQRKGGHPRRKLRMTPEVTR